MFWDIVEIYPLCITSKSQNLPHLSDNPLIHNDFISSNLCFFVDFYHFYVHAAQPLEINSAHQNASPSTLFNTLIRATIELLEQKESQNEPSYYRNSRILI